MYFLREKNEIHILKKFDNEKLCLVPRNKK